MASVFLSYDREDAEKARLIAAALEKAGHSVWWDLHVRGGAQFSKVIEEALKAADAVVVLWSERSVDSAWVRDEAAAGRDTGRLVPISLDRTEPPLGFRQFQTIDLSGWRARGRVPRIDELVAAIDELGGSGGTTVPQPPIASGQASERSRRGLAIVAAAIGVLLVAAALFLWQPWERSSRSPTVAVIPANAGPEARAWARDLLVMLGALQTSHSNDLLLVDQENRENAKLVVEIDGGAEGGQLKATAALLNNRDRNLLWSKRFEGERANPSNLKQQVAHTVGKVLECTLDALGGEGRLDQQTLKLYLNGCADHSDITGYDHRRLIDVFREVVEKAPRFRGGWAKLLMVEGEAAFGRDSSDLTGGARVNLTQVIAAARKHHPDIAEASLIEEGLLPPQKFEARLGLLERTIERHPKNSDALAIYSLLLQKVGRMHDSVEQARRAVQLDPLSPATRDKLITSLTYAGRVDAAREELEKAEKLWPGATNLLWARSGLHLLYGDPKETLRIDRSGKLPMSSEGISIRRQFIEARINPSTERVDRLVADLRSRFERSPQMIAEYSTALALFGREDELFSILLNWQHPGLVNFAVDGLFRPAFRDVHRDSRMIDAARRLGLLEYWLISGHWPDFCFESDMPYDCKAEAAKIAT